MIWLPISYVHLKSVSAKENFLILSNAPYSRYFASSPNFKESLSLDTFFSVVCLLLLSIFKSDSVQVLFLKRVQFYLILSVRILTEGYILEKLCVEIIKQH